jgi:hypothetical protein
MSLKELRLRFIFKLFDPDMSDEVDRLEFRNVITSFVEMILNCKFDNEFVQEKIRSLSLEASNVNVMEKVLDVYVDDIYNTYSYSGEILTYDEWCKWLYSINAIDKILDFTGSLKTS